MTRSIGRDAVEVVGEVRASTGEGPVWHTGRRELLWVDIPAGLVHATDPTTGTTANLEVGQPVGAIALREAGGLIAAVRDGFAFVGPDDGSVELAVPVEDDVPGNRMNDGACDAAGRFWAGTMALDMQRGAGTLYRLDPNLTVTAVLDGLTISNGIGWDLDGETMYFIDSGAEGVDAFEYDMDTGTVRNRRRIVEIPTEEGLPDGMTVDAEGCLWIALWGGWQVRRYTPRGTLDAIVELPASQITSCAFGGNDLEFLFVTSAARGLDEAAAAAQPHAGALFRADVGVAGLAPDTFSG